MGLGEVKAAKNFSPRSHSRKTTPRSKIRYVMKNSVLMALNDCEP